MIFVTVGTHEQPFNRLVEYMDKWAGENNEEVIIQVGFSTYKPQNCKWSKLIPYNQMIENVENARIVITHGGPSSFIMPLQVGKIPIVVPRQKQFDEHVNDHQVEFCNQVVKRQSNIIVVEDINKLGEVIGNYEKNVESIANGLQSNNEKFCVEFAKIVNGLMRK